MPTSQDMTIREATIFTIEQSQDGLKELQGAFQSTANFFDAGNDAQGLQNIKESVLPQISGLYEFCVTLTEAFSAVLVPEQLKKLDDITKSLDSLLVNLAEETERGNFTEVGDILRFDLYDLLSELITFFPQLSDSFRTSECAALDEF